MCLDQFTGRNYPGIFRARADWLGHDGDMEADAEARIRTMLSEARPLGGRKILVVGAGTRESADPDAPLGNGRAIALLAAERGAHVACADISEPAANVTASLITEAVRVRTIPSFTALMSKRLMKPPLPQGSPSRQPVMRWPTLQMITL